MNLQNFFTAPEVREAHHNLAVKAARAEESLVEHIRTVRGGNQNHAFVSGEAVHFHEQLVQSLFAFIVTATETSTTLTTHGIDFVDEQNTRSVLLAGFKQVTHAGCTHANEHFHEVRTRHAKERHSCFTCDSAGEERLTRTRRTNEECPLRDASTELVVLLRVLQKFNEFLQVLLGFVATGNIVERRLLLRVQLAHLALAERERALTATAHLTAHHDVEERNQQNGREERHKRINPCG